MKLQLLAVLLVVAGTYALPWDSEVVVVESSNELSQRNNVEGRIRRFIERISMRIVSAGLDPLETERRDFELIPVTLDLVVKAFVENLSFTGASDISINTLDYNHFFNRLRLDVSLPEIKLSVGDSGLEAIVVGREIEGQLKGSLTIKTIRLSGVGYVDVNIIGGITLRSVSLDFGVGDIESDLTVVVQGTDGSEFINTLLNERIPNFLDDNRDDINGILEDILSVILNRIWSF